MCCDRHFCSIGQSLQERVQSTSPYGALFTVRDPMATLFGICACPIYVLLRCPMIRKLSNICASHLGVPVLATALPAQQTA